MNAFFKDAEWRLAGKWLFYSGIVGVVAGFGAVLFHVLSESLFEAAMSHLGGYVPRPTGDARAISDAGPIIPMVLLLVPAAGGLFAGWLVFRFAPEAEGHGTDAVLEAYHQKAGQIRKRVPFVKALASVLTLGTGGSGGREGPIAQIGAGFGSFFANRLGMSTRDRRILVAAGMGAGIGAIFRAPLAGALFAAEIHYREAEFEAEAMIPSAISSIVSYCIFSLFYGWRPLFTTGSFDFSDPLELLPYGVLALVVSVGAYAFIKTFYGLRDLFHKLPMPLMLKPAVGGLLTGAVGVTLYVLVGDKDVLSVLSFGYGILQGAIDVKVASSVLVMVAVGKMLTTGLTIGSGGSGGVFGPSMVIGGSLGGATGAGLHELFPELVRHPGAYVLVGMAGFFAGAANTPVSTIIMVSEMTGNYQLLLPALWVTTICYLLLRRTGIYEKQCRSRVDSPAHRGDMHFDVLEDMTVRDVYNRERPFVTFPRNAPLGDILKRAGGTHQSYFPIVDDDRKLCGIFSLNDIREFMYDEAIWALAVADDVATEEVLRVSERDSLNTAIRRFTYKNIDELPVVANDDPDRVIGLLRRKEVLDAYNRRLWALREEAMGNESRQ